MRQFFPRGSQDGKTSACRFRVRENARKHLLFFRFFGLEGRRKEKNGNGEILFVSRKERGYGKREYMASSDGLAEADK